MARGQPESLGEAILRELGAFGQNVGQQIQANQQFNVQSEQRNLIDRLNFEAGEQQRQALLGQGQQRLDISGRRADIAQFEADRRFAEGSRIFDTLKPQKERKIPTTVQAIAAPLIDEGVRTGNQELIDQGFGLIERGATAGRAPTEEKEPDLPGGLTPAQTIDAVDQVFQGRRDRAISAAGATSLADLGDRAQGGLDKAQPGFLGFGRVEPDSTALRALQEVSQIGSPEQRRAFVAGDSLRFTNPELFVNDPQQGPTLDTLTSRRVEPGISQSADNLVRAQSRILKAVGGVAIPEAVEPDVAPSRRQLIEQFGGLGAAGPSPVDTLPALEPTPEQILDSSQPGNLAADQDRLALAQNRIAGAIGAITPEQDQRGRELYDDWDQSTPAQKAEIVKRGFPTE